MKIGHLHLNHGLLSQVFLLQHGDNQNHGNHYHLRHGVHHLILGNHLLNHGALHLNLGGTLLLLQLQVNTILKALKTNKEFQALTLKLLHHGTLIHLHLGDLQIQAIHGLHQALLHNGHLQLFQHLVHGPNQYLHGEHPLLLLGQSHIEIERFNS